MRHAIVCMSIYISNQILLLIHNDNVIVIINRLVILFPRPCHCCVAGAEKLQQWFFHQMDVFANDAGALAGVDGIYVSERWILIHDCRTQCHYNDLVLLHWQQ